MSDKHLLQTSRRGIVTASAAVALGALTTGPSEASTPSQSLLPDLSFLQDTPIADLERLRRFMAQAGLDALVVSHPANVFYLTNHWPQLDRMGMEGAGIAIVSRDPQRPITLVMHAFLYYFTHSPESKFTDRIIFTYTNPTGAAATPDSEPPAAPARTMRIVDPEATTSLDAHRFDMYARARPASADASWALKKALIELKLDSAVIGIDETALEGAIKLRGFSGQIRPGENIIRRARLAKSPAELKLMRFAAQANVDAAMIAARRARTLGTSRRLRAEFYAEAAKRGNSGHFMVIGGTSSEVIDQPFVDGTSVSIDCVSTCRFYHGDFGRTIFIGEPHAAVKRAAEAVGTAWQEIRSQLRPGMRFADIPRIGRATLSRLGVDINVSFTPHSVGLFHTDHPQPSLISPRQPEDLMLEENMVLSVDCPVFMAGLGGTIHLEDLMWIRDGRAEPIHTIPPPVIIV